MKILGILKWENFEIFSISLKSLILFAFITVFCENNKVISAQVIYKNETRGIIPSKNLNKCLAEPPKFFIMDGSYSTLNIKADFEFNIVLDFKDKTQKVQLTGIGLSHQIKQNNKITKQVDSKNTNKIYEANIQIYAKCVASDITYNQIIVPLVLKPKNIRINTQKQDQKTSVNSKVNKQQNQIIKQLQRKIQIKTIIYCISDYSILQSNLFIKDLYATFIIFIFGFLLQFKALQNVNLFARILHVSIYLFGSFFMNDWMSVVASSYAGIFWFACYFKSEAPSSYLILMRSIWTISFAVSIPTVFGSQMGQKMPQGFVLYLVNFCVIANNVMLISGLINLRRLRHIFYYMIVLGTFQYFCQGLTQKNFVFQLMYPKVIPLNCNTEPIFFIIMIIPVCDYFFQSYSPRRLLKFFIMIIPILSPIKVSVTFVCFVICGIWFMFQSINAGSCIKLIKFRK